MGGGWPGTMKNSLWFSGALVVALQDVMRDDTVTPSYPREAILANAPREEDGYFRVKAVLE